VQVGPERARVRLPDDFEMPEAMRAGAPIASEDALYHHRLPAAQAFARANGLDRVALDAPRRRLGIVTTGKAYLDVRQALESLGIDPGRAADLGLAVYKVGLCWPLDPVGARRFASDLSHLLVVEEKRPLLEEQLGALLYNDARRPTLFGKRDVRGAPLVPDTGELSPAAVEDAIRRWLRECAPEAAASLRPARDAPAKTSRAGATPLARMPSFCSGCPHNTSTRLPEGSVAGGGIGCHGMSAWMPSRRTVLFSHMGGEGAHWIGIAPFTETPHIFQNLGDGTYFHSGLLAIRANVTAGTNITYKVLVNGGVAMTGGQPIEGGSIHGEITTPEIARQLDAEGVRRIAVVADDPSRYSGDISFPKGVTVHHRDELDRVQRMLREVKGVSALLYDQTCAAEARRLRKRGELPDPERRVVINERLCEGCGDCSEQSNCISIEPVETELGRKRRVNQSSCNKDYSCVKGYCPSFVSVTGGRLRRTGAQASDAGGDEPFRTLPLPERLELTRPYDVLVTGIGGTGVVTLGALLGMAAHLEGKGCSVLDVTGLSQKNGAVASHIRVAERAEDLHATRIAAGSADLVLGCDIVVTASSEHLAKLGEGRTTPVVNRHVTPTADFANDPDLDLSSGGMEAAIRAAAGAERCRFVDATRLATVLLGDAIYTNPLLLGFAFQLGRLPVGLPALERAIELNGRAVETNLRALSWGRLAAHDLEAVERAARPGLPAPTEAPVATGLTQLVAARAEMLTAYQNAPYAERYRSLVARVAQREQALVGGTRLAEAVARYAFKLMAYKDEYEVARLYSDGEFRAQLESEFEGDYALRIHLAPQFVPAWLPRTLSRRDPDTGRVKKVAFGAWMFALLRLLARLRFLRGTPIDPFGWTPHRRLERRLIRDYEQALGELLDGLSTETLDLAVEIASIPELIRGFDRVKERQLEVAQAKRADLLDAFRRRAGSAAIG
jgi:indolepyruvate ferredoxin oxidoreductase